MCDFDALRDQKHYWKLYHIPETHIDRDALQYVYAHVFLNFPIGYMIYHNQDTITNFLAKYIISEQDQLLAFAHSNFKNLL